MGVFLALSIFFFVLNRYTILLIYVLQIILNNYMTSLVINHKATEVGAVNIQYLRRRGFRDSRAHEPNEYIKYTSSIRYDVILSFIAKYLLYM